MAIENIARGLSPREGGKMSNGGHGGAVPALSGLP